MNNLTNHTLIESLLLDKEAHTLNRVGRVHMDYLSLWRSWLNS